MKVTITGIADVNRILREIAPREAKNLLSATVMDLTKELARDAKGNTPNDPNSPEWLGDGYGNKRERGDRNTVAASVIVKNTKGKGEAGRNYFWRFLEYGQGPDNVEHAMFLKAFQKMKPEIIPIYLRIFGKKLEARLKRVNKARAKAGG